MNRSTLTRRTRLRDGVNRLKRTRIAPISARRRRVNRERRRALHQRYGTHPPCHACPVLTAAGVTISWRCYGAVDGHEVRTRGRGGSIVDVDNIRPVCRGSHSWLTGHPIEAAAVGLVVNSWRTDA